MHAYSAVVLSDASLGLGGPVTVPCPDKGDSSPRMKLDMEEESDDSVWAPSSELSARSEVKLETEPHVNRGHLASVTQARNQ